MSVDARSTCLAVDQRISAPAGGCFHDAEVQAAAYEIRIGVKPEVGLRRQTAWWGGSQTASEAHLLILLDLTRICAWLSRAYGIASPRRRARAAHQNAQQNCT